MVELHPSGAGASDLVYGTYFGSSGQEVITAITVDTQGIIYATGWTLNSFVDGATTLFPATPNAYDTDPPHVPDDVDAFVLRLNPSGNGAADLLYSTYLGTEASFPFLDQDRGKAIAVDATGAVYVLGATDSSAFPTTPGAYRPTGTVSQYEANIFLAKLRPSGNGAADLIYATYVAKGYDNEFDDHEYSWRTLAVDDLGDVYTGGAIAVDEQLAATPGAFNTEFGNSIVVRLRLAGQGDKDLIYGTYLGSFVRALTVAETGQIALGGITNECDFSTTADAWQPECAAGWITTVAGLRMPERSLVTGGTVGPEGAPIVNAAIVAGGIYTAFTDREGVFSVMLPPGEQTLTPIQRSFAWEPPQRTVTVPPAARRQDFVGYRIVQKTAQPNVRFPVAYGDTITYTLHLRGPGFADAILADPVPTYTIFLSETLQSLPGIIYHAESNTLSGTLPLTPMAGGVITFAVRVAVTGTVESGPVIVNQAQVYPAAAPEQAIWSEEVVRYTYPWFIFVPFMIDPDRSAP